MKRHLIERNEKIKEVFALLRQADVSVDDACENIGRAFKLEPAYVREIAYGRYDEKRKAENGRLP